MIIHMIPLFFCCIYCTCCRSASFVKVYWSYYNTYKSHNSIIHGVLNILSTVRSTVCAPADIGYPQSQSKRGSLRNKQLCFPNTLNWICESGMALLQRKKNDLSTSINLRPDLKVSTVAHEP